MPCTTILVGKGASYDGSTMIARNDDSPSGVYTAKKVQVTMPAQQPRTYQSAISHVTIELPDNPMRYTCVPDAVRTQGIWAACGVNDAEVGMTATETVTSNPRVLGADPLVCLQPAKGEQPEIPGGIGEEDIVAIVLPYIHSAREGVLRLGGLLEEYGTYEMNGIAFSDADEIWWLETIGGHHWIAARVPDDEVVVMPNQFGLDHFDFDDAFGEWKSFMCSADLRTFIEENHLDLTLDGEFNPREAFGSHDDSDHVYNTPRAWYAWRCFLPTSCVWDGPYADFRPDSDNIPWSAVPERKITVEDVKYILSAHFQGTPYDPYRTCGDTSMSGAYRSIGVNRTDHMGLIQIRPYAPAGCRALEWISFGSNVFNAPALLYANTDEIPAYLGSTAGKVSTDTYYWSSRLIGAMADASFKKCQIHIERYQQIVMSKNHRFIKEYDKLLTEETDSEKKRIICRKANKEMAEMLQEETDKLLDHVLYERSNQMKNSYARSDA